MDDLIIHTDCLHYKGDLPCTPHKQHGVHCENCSHYVKRDKRILIIKLGAIGDIIRTTPILRALPKQFPNCEVTWITNFPETLPKSAVHQILKFSSASVTHLLADEFDIIYNLDKDKEACALTNMIKANLKKGFMLKDGKAWPIDQDAVHKYHTGLFDTVNIKNTKSYPEEIFEIMGLPYNKEEYLLDPPSKQFNVAKGLPKPVIGLNTGCGVRWNKRLWPETYWVELVKLLKKKRYTPLLLGGKQEHDKNLRIQQNTGAHYYGYLPIPDFTNLIKDCDLIVTAVTMAFHIALGYKTKVVLFNNVFNKHEFEMYGQGEIIEPENPCLGCFTMSCDLPCMEKINVEEVMETIDRVLALPRM